MDIKYTTDGRKVVVIGSLNSTEKIVQEIFVIDNAEIPSGEHFVVKSLHDAPAVSWHQKEAEKWRSTYESTKAKYGQEMERIDRELRIARDVARQTIKFIKSIGRQNHQPIFERIADLLDGKITHVVVYGAWRVEIKEYNYWLLNNEYGIKLMSLFGKDDGTMTLRINWYGDGSGGWEDMIPCQSFDEAKIEFAKKVSELKQIDDTQYAAVKKYGVTIRQELIDDLFHRTKSNIEKRIEQHRQQMENAELELSALTAPADQGGDKTERI